MKLKNILPILSFLFVAVACSMEDDVLNDLSNNTGEGKSTATTELGEAAIAFGVEMPVATKATQDANTAEAEISHCSLILLEGNSVIKAYDNVFVNDAGKVIVSTKADNAVDTVKMLVKTGKIYNLMVVANSPTQFAAGTTYNTLAKINKAIQTLSYDDATDTYSPLVKVGTKEVNLTNYEGYASTTDALRNPVVEKVELTQLTARIELAAFNVKGFNTGKGTAIDPTINENVKVTSVVLSNVNPKGFVDFTEHIDTPVSYMDDIVKSWTGGLSVHAAIDTEYKGYEFTGSDKPIFYSYRNTNRIKMTVNYTVGTLNGSCEFLINRNNGGDVSGGNLYRVVIEGVFSYSDATISEFKCYTLDWQGNEYSVDMTDITNP